MFVRLRSAGGVKKRLLKGILKLHCASQKKFEIFLMLFLPMSPKRIQKLVGLLAVCVPGQITTVKRFLSMRIANRVAKSQDSRFVKNAVTKILQNQDMFFIYRPILSMLISTSFREQCAKLVADVKNDHFQCHAAFRKKPDLGQAIKEGEILKIGKVFDSKQIHEIHDYLKDKCLANSHYFVYGNERFSFEKLQQSNYNYGSYSRETIVNVPHLLPLLYREDIVDSVATYLGTVPTLASVNLFWTFNRNSVGSVSQFHRDTNDFTSVSFFIYLTDVNNAEDGTHEYIKKSSHFDYVSDKIKSKAPYLSPHLFFKERWPQGAIEEIFDREIEAVTGEAGTAFCNDNYCLHRGLSPQLKYKQDERSKIMNYLYFDVGKIV